MSKKYMIFIAITLIMLSFQCLSNDSDWRFGSRFKAFDIVTMIKEDYPSLSSKAETISFYSGYYLLNPFLLAEYCAKSDKDVKIIAEKIYSDLNSKKPPILKQVFLNSINKRIAKNGIGAVIKTADLSNLPALDVPFDHDKKWYFRGVHPYSVHDNEDAPYSSIDITSDWNMPWNYPTGGEWVSAAHDGVVTKFSGCSMIITHDSGWATSYYHLSNIQYSTGDVVKAGDKIANFANTHIQATCNGGYSDTPHVHFSLIKDDEYYSLDGIKLSGWKIHSGEFPYDTRPEYFWIEKKGIKKYAIVDAIGHDYGENIIDYRYSGVYSSSDIEGHGINITITELINEGIEELRNVIFVAFYTYDDSGKANFYVGNRDFDFWRIDSSKTISMFQTSGGNFSQLEQVDFDTGVTEVGDMSIHFIDCSTVEINFNLLEPISNTSTSHNLILDKTIGVPKHVCEAPRVAVNR